MPARQSSPFEIQALRVVEQPTRHGDIADTRGLLARAYGATDRTLVLIRPDGHVGLISDAGDVAAVSGYFDALG